jgi:hypothetical protein
MNTQLAFSVGPPSQGAAAAIDAVVLGFGNLVIPGGHFRARAP